MNAFQFNEIAKDVQILETMTVIYFDLKKEKEEEKNIDNATCSLN